MLKVVLLDFDGTLVGKDILDIVCGIAGKEKESEAINRDFHAGKVQGLTPLITRINFLRGVSTTQIVEKLNENPYLISGARELFTYLRQHAVLTIIHSGNITPILSYYKELLGADYIVGTDPKMDGKIIRGIAEEDFSGRDFKVIGVKKILEKLSIDFKETLAIGDSPADKTMFAMANQSIAINPKNGIQEFATYTIQDSLNNAIPIIEKIISNKIT